MRKTTSYYFSNPDIKKSHKNIGLPLNIDTLLYDEEVQKY